MIVQRIINEMTLHPKRLFLIDGLGALLSAFLLGVILVQFESIFGMPQRTLYFLAFLPCVFAVYDLFCYFRITENWKPYVQAIAIANLLYCFISIGLVFCHYSELTNLGLTYFLLEFAIVLILVYIELKTAANLKR